jgi:hypothetical protein
MNAELVLELVLILIGIVSTVLSILATRERPPHIIVQMPQPTECCIEK